MKRPFSSLKNSMANSIKKNTQPDKTIKKEIEWSEEEEEKKKTEKKKTERERQEGEKKRKNLFFFPPFRPLPNSFPPLSLSPSRSLQYTLSLSLSL